MLQELDAMAIDFQGFRGPLRMAFEMEMSESCFGKAKERNARRWYYLPSRTHFGLSTPPKRLTAVYSQNELLEVPSSS